MTERRSDAERPAAGEPALATWPSCGLIRDVPDFPTPGVLFKDITPLLADGRGVRARSSTRWPHRAAGGQRSTWSSASRRAASSSPRRSPSRSASGFVPVRKAGKLPGADASARRTSWSTAPPTIEVHADAVRPGQRVLVVDDVLATGGTAAAAAASCARSAASWSASPCCWS